MLLTEIGMVSPLGPTFLSSCAAARAGIRRVRLESDDAELDPDESISVQAHAIQGVTDGFEGAARLARMMELALLDLSTRWAPEERRRRTAVLLALPGDYLTGTYEESPAGARPAGDAEELWKRLLGTIVASSRVDLGDWSLRCFREDQTALVSAIDAAGQVLSRRDADQCLVVAVDSLCDQPQLEVLEGIGILKSDDRPDGVIPGEAAVAFVLEAGPLPTGRRCLALVDGWAKIERGVHRFAEGAPDGRGSAAAIQRCLGRCHPSQLITDLNGDPWRAFEWGSALPQLAIDIANLPAWPIGESFGELGAAAGGVGVAMAVHGLLRRKSWGDSLIVLKSYAGPSGGIGISSQG